MIKAEIDTFYSNTDGTRCGKSETVEDKRDLQIVWKNVILLTGLHIAAVYGAFLWFSGDVMWQTFIWASLLLGMSGFGITAGVHRLWAHKSYKATLPLRIILCICQTLTAQNSILEWCRDHRVHHKFAETDADPHNINRGFFFAHMGWLMCRKHPLVKEKGKSVDISDLKADPVLVFQNKHYILLTSLVCFFVPTIVPWFFWGENFMTAWSFCALFRYCLTLHVTWLTNSVSHMYGSRPYDDGIGSRENKTVSFLAFGEGWHNYHHVFPWDYKTAEVGVYRYNFAAAFIDFFAKVGWAYDLKSVPREVVRQRVNRTGDGTHGDPNTHPGPWGWGDRDSSVEDKNVTVTLNALKED